MPDATCSEVLETEPDYQYVYFWGIPEVRALRWAEELGAEPGLLSELARPCGICRAKMVRTRYAVLERDLRRLSEHLAEAGAKTQERVLSISNGIALVHGLIDDIEATKERIRSERRGEGLGYVYAISDQERALHGLFAAHRIRGEWFRHVPEIVEYFTNGS